MSWACRRSSRSEPGLPDRPRTASAPPAGAWAAIIDCAWDICRQPIDEGKAAAEVARRDRAVGDFDQYLATAGWDLWRDYEAVVPLTSDTLAGWWAAQPAGRAVLILDGLSLREVPWLLTGATKHGFLVHNSAVNGGTAGRYQPFCQVARLRAAIGAGEQLRGRVAQAGRCPHGVPATSPGKTRGAGGV